MMTTKKHECIVCGRKFPHGQGVIVKLGKLELTFHSNKCVSKFFRLLVERMEDTNVIERIARQLIRELAEKRKRLNELKKKKI